MTVLTQSVDSIGNQQILLSVVASLFLLGVVWRLDAILTRYTGVSDHQREDVREFREVATVTVVIGAVVWIDGQPTPPWLGTMAERVGWPATRAWVVEFLPGFVVSDFGALLVTVLGAWWVWELRFQGDRIIERFVARKYDETLAPIAENVWDIAVVAGFILLVFTQWGIGIAALLAPAGILGIVVGFAARKSIANFFGSLALYADETYQRGDYIELENGLAGTVRDISVRSTALQTLDGDLVYVPNAELNDATITNKSSPTTSRRISSQVGVSYETDPETTRQVLYEAGQRVTQTQEPRIQLREFGDSAIVFDVFVWIQNPEDRIELRDELNMEIYRTLDEADIGVPYPQREVTLDRPIAAADG